MGTYSGGKFSSSHSTAIEAVEPLLKFVSANPDVSKISLGFIRSIRGNGTNLHRMKIDATTETACIKVTVRGGISVQEIRIYTPERTQLSKQIREKFSHAIEA